MTSSPPFHRPSIFVASAWALFRDCLVLPRYLAGFARFVFVTASVAGVCAGGDAISFAEPLPREVQGVDISEHLGKSIDKNLVFTNADGRRVRLADYLKSGKPTILTLNYFSCPMLCGLQLTGLTAGLKQLSSRLGRDYRVLTISIDPRDTVKRAAEQREMYLTKLGFGGKTPGSAVSPSAPWDFLVGQQPQIDAIAQAVGFKYNYDEKSGDFAHAPLSVFLTSDGTISRYLHGITFPSRELRFAFLDASEGRLGSSVDRILLTCFHYDPTTGRYGMYAMGVMRLGGAMAAAVVGIFLLILWRRDRKRRPVEPLA